MQIQCNPGDLPEDEALKKTESIKMTPPRVESKSQLSDGKGQKETEKQTAEEAVKDAQASNDWFESVIFQQVEDRYIEE